MTAEEEASTIDSIYRVHDAYQRFKCGEGSPRALAILMFHWGKLQHPLANDTQVIGLFEINLHMSLEVFRGWIQKFHDSLSIHIDS